MAADSHAPSVNPVRAERGLSSGEGHHSPDAALSDMPFGTQLTEIACRSGHLTEVGVLVWGAVVHFRTTCADKDQEGGPGQHVRVSANQFLEDFQGTGPRTLCRTCTPIWPTEVLRVLDELRWLHATRQVIEDLRSQDGIPAALSKAVALHGAATHPATNAALWVEASASLRELIRAATQHPDVRFAADVHLYLAGRLDGTLPHDPALVDVIPPGLAHTDAKRRAELAPLLAQACVPLWRSYRWWETRRAWAILPHSRLWVAAAASGADFDDVVARRASHDTLLVRTPAVLAKVDPTGSGDVLFGDWPLTGIEGPYASSMVDIALDHAVAEAPSQIPAQNPAALDKARHMLDALRSAQI